MENAISIPSFGGGVFTPKVKFYKTYHPLDIPPTLGISNQYQDLGTRFKGEPFLLKDFFNYWNKERHSLLVLLDMIRLNIDAKRAMEYVGPRSVKLKKFSNSFNSVYRTIERLFRLKFRQNLRKNELVFETLNAISSDPHYVITGFCRSGDIVRFVVSFNDSKGNLMDLPFKIALNKTIE